LDAPRAPSPGFAQGTSKSLSSFSYPPPLSLSHTHTNTFQITFIPSIDTHTHTHTNKHTHSIYTLFRSTHSGHTQKTDTDLAFREHASVQMDTHRLTAPLRDALTDVAAKVNVFKGMFSLSLSLSLSLSVLSSAKRQSAASLRECIYKY
jgi:hypothetical protein